jgi:hypothetical protein
VTRTVGQVLDVETLRGEILTMQHDKYLVKWVHLDELLALIDRWEDQPSHEPDSMVEGVGRNRHVMVRYRLEYGRMVPHIEGQWTHVKWCGVKEWALDPATSLDRAEMDAAEERDPAAPWNTAGYGE